MGLSAIYGMLAGVYHWFPKMYGRMMNKNLGYLHFWTTFICAYGVFFPMHFLGLAGMPRRVPDFPDSYNAWNNIASLGSCITMVSSAFFVYVVYNTLTANQRVSFNP